MADILQGYFQEGSSHHPFRICLQDPCPCNVVCPEEDVREEKEEEETASQASPEEEEARGKRCDNNIG